MSTQEFIQAEPSTETKTKPLRAPRGIGQRKHSVMKPFPAGVPDKKAEGVIPLARLKKLLDYNPETMLFTWKQTRGAGFAGRVAGSSTIYGHVNITIEGRVYWTTDLVEYWTTGLYTEHSPYNDTCGEMHRAFEDAREQEKITQKQRVVSNHIPAAPPPKPLVDICLGPRPYVRTKSILDNLYDDDFTEYDENH